MKEKIESGVVKWFKQNRGFGFICLDEPFDGVSEVFCHISELQNEETLAKGDLVEFNIGQHEKGPLAKRVVVIGSDPTLFRGGS